MAHIISNDEKLRAQDKEITELKISALDDKFNSFKEEVLQSLKLILEQTSKTNGSVAKVVESIHKHELENIERDRALDDLNKHREGTMFWYTIQTNKWIALLAAVALLSISSAEIKELLFKLF